jgi:hybrid cluster-associated redox disulfide protein
MKYPLLSPRMLVADLLALSPLVAPFLLDLRVDCVGCSMNRFCTLEELCTLYGLELEVILQNLQNKMSLDRTQ